jgi:hypothetical protein
MRTCHRLTALLAVLMLFTAGAALAQEEENTTTFLVTIRNITGNQIISPPVVVSHSLLTKVFRLGRPASPEVAAIAEDADASGLMALVANDPEVLEMVVAEGGPVPPGQSRTLEIHASHRYPLLSMLGMLVTTNDAFFGVESLSLNNAPRVTRFTAPAYDAGSEANNESCAFIPGPPCGNPGVRATGGAEGFIHVHPGIHGVGDLAASAWDWRNPVVHITVVRLGV